MWMETKKAELFFWREHHFLRQNVAEPQIQQLPNASMKLPARFAISPPHWLGFW